MNSERIGNIIALIVVIVALGGFLYACTTASMDRTTVEVHGE